MKKAIIITAHGAHGFAGYLDIGPQDVVIAADGGYDAALSCNIKPHMLVGDMDSVSAIPEGIQTIRLPMDKDDTDTHYCASLALEYGFTEVVIVGGMAGRLDHTLANLHTLAYLASRGVSASMRDQNTISFMLYNDEIELTDKQGRRLSLFAYGGNAEGVIASGVQFPLKDATLTATFPLGVSNNIISPIARIGVKNGFLLVLLCA